MRKNMRLTSVMAIVTVMALLIGSLAFFTDRVAAKATVTTMPTAVDIVPVDPDDPTVEIDDLSEFWAEGNATVLANYNPADYFDLSYTLKNKGSMPVTVRETIVITSNQAMADGTPEFVLCSETAAGTYGGYKAVGNLATKVSATQYKYVKVSDAPIAAGATVDKDYFVVFSENADNDFQGKTCTVNYLVEALQSDGSWTEIAEATLSNGTWTGGAPAA